MHDEVLSRALTSTDSLHQQLGWLTCWEFQKLSQKLDNPREYLPYLEIEISHDALALHDCVASPDLTRLMAPRFTNSTSASIAPNHQLAVNPLLHGLE